MHFNITRFAQSELRPQAPARAARNLEIAQSRKERVQKVVWCMWTKSLLHWCNKGLHWCKTGLHWCKRLLGDPFSSWSEHLLQPLLTLVARAIRNAIRADRFARIIRNRNPYFYSASGRFARITRISDSRESPDSRESCESIRANHATKLLTTVGNFEVSSPCSRHLGSQTQNA